MTEILMMNRRALMRNVALLLGAAAVPTMAGCKSAMEGDGALDEGQMTLLSAIADTIIPATDTPGALAAKVPQLLSGLMRDWASADTRAQIVAAIEAIGGLNNDADFAKLDAAKRTQLLTDYDTAAVEPGEPPKVPLKGVAALLAGPPTANPDYVLLKRLIIDLYYTTEIAMTQELLYEHVPGAFVPSLKVTPETRPFSGVGVFG